MADDSPPTPQDALAAARAAIEAGRLEEARQQQEDTWDAKQVELHDLCGRLLAEACCLVSGKKQTAGHRALVGRSFRAVAGSLPHYWWERNLSRAEKVFQKEEFWLEVIIASALRAARDPATPEGDIADVLYGVLADLRFSRHDLPIAAGNLMLAANGISAVSREE